MTGNQILKLGRKVQQDNPVDLYLAGEVTGNEMLQLGQDNDFLEVVERSKDVDGVELESMDARNKMSWRTNSANPDRAGTRNFYNQTIKIPFVDNEFAGASRDDIDDIDVLERAKNAILDEDISCTCSDPSDKWWGYKYWRTQRDAQIPQAKMDIPAEERQPILQGYVCKHLYKILSEISKGKHDSDIEEAFKQQIRANKFRGL